MSETDAEAGGAGRPAVAAESTSAAEAEVAAGAERGSVPGGEAACAGPDAAPAGDLDQDAAASKDAEEAEKGEVSATMAVTAAAEEACREILSLGGFEVRVLAVPGTPVRVEIQGEDSARVIGRKGATLQALQYIVSRIVGRRVSRYVPVKVDVEGYRVRRENTLRALAHRLAAEAVREGRSIELEPMTPEERRVIHLALAGDPDVETRSEGEGDRRHVVIVPSVWSRPDRRGREQGGNR